MPLHARDEPPQVYVESTWLYGAIVTAILYGVVVVLYAMCARSLLEQIRSRDNSRKKHWLFLIYVHFLFALSTIYVVTNSRITQLGFINNRNFPGGPSAYELTTSSLPENFAFVVSNWCADALMIWRCIVVYRDSRFHFFVAGLGLLMLLASMVTGTLWIVTVSQPEGSTPSSWMSFTLLFPYISVSLAINVFICVLTVVRLLYHRACISKALGPGYGVLYASFAAMIVESAAVYSICSLLYLIPYAANSPLANAFLQILGEAQVIAPLLIIYRVSEGKAWTRDMATRHPSGSQAMRRLSVQPPPANLHSPRRLDVDMALKDSQHTEHEGSVHFAEEEVKSISV